MTEAQVWEALAEVPDPEIPVVSVVDLGVVRGVRVDGYPLKEKLKEARARAGTAAPRDR